MQMMVNIIKNIFGVGAQKICASALCSPHLQNVLSVLCEASTVTVATNSIINAFTSIIEGLAGIVIAWFFLISKFVFQIVDLIQYLVYKLAGINLSSEITFDLPIFKILLSDTILDLFMALFIIGLILLIIFTIIAIVKSEYEIAIGLEQDSKKVKRASAKIVKSTLTSTALMLIIPFIMIAVMAFGSVFLTSINSVLNPDGTSSTTLGGQVFVASAHKANKYRIYAEKNERIPILYDFVDPYDNGTAYLYTRDELANEYGAWNSGESYYANQTNGGYASFASTLVYKNNKLYNKQDNYGGYEKWVSTPEQYYIMADFIDYAVKNNLEFYIKNASGEDIDWDNSSSNVKITDGVFNPATGTFTLSYVDNSNVNKYDDSYTLTLETGEFIASSPIADTTKTIAELLAITMNEDMESTVDSKLFRMLERVEGSTNVVKWKTESIDYNKETYTVYELTKRYYNVTTGMLESRATVPVARKQPAGAYYILNKDEDGKYHYTNQVIEYHNNGKLYQDLIEPVYVYGNWPEKLYNDLKVIFADINIDNYINYDNWADMLGEYYASDLNFENGETVSFATTLIHPLGLIMSELFLGVTFEEEGQLTDFTFTTQYMKDVIQSICFAVGGEEDYWQLKCEIDSFVTMFNGLFTPIIEELQKIEGFDLYDEDEYSVQAYVYKSYLASVMLSDSANEFFETLGYEILNLNNLAAVIHNSSSNNLYNSNGELMYEIKYKTDDDGNYLKLQFLPKNPDSYTRGAIGKYVYNVSGAKAVVCDENGYISDTSKYVPVGGVYDMFTRLNEDNGHYEIWYGLRFYDVNEYNEYYREQLDKHPNNDIPTWEELFARYFTTYYKAGYDHDRTFTYNNETYSIVCDTNGNIKFINNGGNLRMINLPTASDDYGLYFVPKEDTDFIVENVGDTLKYKVLVENKYVTADKVNFEDYFEPAKVRLYVYDNVEKANPNSKIGPTPASDIILKGDDEAEVDEILSFAIDYSIKLDTGLGKYVVQNEDIINWQIDFLSQDYYLYEKEYIAITEQVYLTYDNLPQESKDLIDGAIDYLYKVSEHDTDQRNETFLPYLEIYKAGRVYLSVDKNVYIEVEDILNAPMISSYKALEFEKKSLNDYVDYIVENQNKSTRRVYKDKYQEICSYYKYNIVKSIQEYMSYRISTGYEVIVNGQKFTIEQAMSSTEFMEIVFGNNLTYDGLVEQLSRGVLLDDLTKFNKSAMTLMSSHLQADLKELQSVIDKLERYLIVNKAAYNSSSAPVSLSLTDRELEIINTFYKVKTGDELNINLKGLSKYLQYATIPTPAGKEPSFNSTMYQKIIDVLKICQDDLGIIIQRYMQGDNDICSTTDCSTNIEACVLLSRYVRTIADITELSYVDQNYSGIIDSNGTWGILRDFLKDFGSLCFDLQTKSNFNSLSYGQKDEESLVGANTTYISELLDMLNGMLIEVDFGSEGKSITEVAGIEDLIVFVYDEDEEEYIYTELTGDNYYSELISESKYYIAILCDYFEKTTEEYRQIIANSQEAYNMMVKFMNGRYTMQPNSLIFTTFIKDYIEYFKYNADTTDDSFLEYMYDEYYIEVDNNLMGGNNELSNSDKLSYYFMYMESFDNFKFANNGNYYSDLSTIQQKVVQDAVKYYKQIKDETETTLSEDLEYSLECLEKLNSFVFGVGGENPENAGDAEIADILESNLDIINLYNVLDFMGLEFEVDKNLRDYRIDAFNQLVEFSEYSGESVASIQSRYLSLLYLACSDFTLNPEGASYVGFDDNSKQILLSLAGVANKADELLVDLQYEGNYSSSVADEKYGSIFIICTYNESTKKYEPFIFASEPDKYNTPVTNYYRSVNNQVTYYPVIAKGIFDAYGNPTAIREVNGNIEFYREEVTRFNLATISMDFYTVTQEDVSTNYGVVGKIVNSIKQTINRFLVADSLGDSFEYLDTDLEPDIYYGTKTTCIYHLDSGYANLNYMFYEKTGIGVTYLYDITQLNIIILVLASAVILDAMWKVFYGIVSSIFQIAILFAISPVIVGVKPVKPDAYKNWKKNFVKQFFVMYGFIVALNSYFILLILIDKMGSLIPAYSERSISILNDTALFSGLDVLTIVSVLLSTAVLIVATTLLKSMTDTFSGTLFSGDDAMKSGAKVKGQTEAVVAEGEYFMSGYLAKDSMAKAYRDATSSFAPLLGPDAIRERMNEREAEKNKKLAKQYEQDLISQGVDSAKASDAAKAYRDALNANIKARNEHVKQENDRRKKRLDDHNKRMTQFVQPPSDPKEVKCKHCGAKFKKSQVKGTNKCPICQQKNAFK